MYTPKVSVIVPVYNVEKYIDKCLKSLVTQTLHDIEIICVDDCGADNSMTIVRKYADADNRIKIISNKHNLGLSTSRNTGVARARADYIMFCDSDDWFEPGMCEIMYNTITCDNTDIALCGVNVIYEADIHHKKSDSGYFKIKCPGVFTVTEDLTYKTCGTVWNKIYKRSIISDYGIRFPDGLKYEDVCFFNMYMLWAKKISFITDKLYNYRRRSGSIMNQSFQQNTVNHAIDGMGTAAWYYEYIKSHGLLDAKTVYFWRNVFINNFYFALDNALNPTHRREIFDYAIGFIRTTATPELPRPVAKMLEMILMRNDKMFHGVKYMGGIICVKYYTTRLKIKLLGIPIWRVKYFGNRERFDLFAFIPVWVRKSPMARVNL